MSEESLERDIKNAVLRYHRSREAILLFNPDVPPFAANYRLVEGIIWTQGFLEETRLIKKRREKGICYVYPYEITFHCSSDKMVWYFWPSTAITL